MPVVILRVGKAADDGREEVLQEYLCDHPGCPNPAQHVMGCAREVGAGYAVCDEHARGREPRAA